MANRGHFERYLEPDDWLIVPPTPLQMGALDWRRHSEVMDAAYAYTRVGHRNRRGTPELKRQRQFNGVSLSIELHSA